MAKYSGTIHKNDLEGGIWELHTKGGERYQIRGGDDDLRQEGQAVEVEGSIDQGGFGIGMTGAYLDVTAWAKQ
jgi:hypothetical protein